MNEASGSRQQNRCLNRDDYKSNHKRLEPGHLSTYKRIILKEQTTEGEGEIVVVEWFDMPDGRIFYAYCIGPGADKFSYQLKLYIFSFR
ncbi:hypothetical protein F2Q69_00030782 [Brassica cretica]|uniref:Uncharacterized protein n=1 Tax=Brassica cretica TaxID=69181 RepID=A0A8S9S6Y3_BRACR|nr:hypothetical protein F2Q69_00030782 [Brassica cretica]